MTNGSTSAFDKFVMSLLTLLIAAGVVGVWHLSQSFVRLDERVGTWTIAVSKRLDRVEAQHDVYAQKIEDLYRRYEDIKPPGR